MKKPGEIYGLLAEFAEADALVKAAKQARKAGYRRMDAYSPFPIEDLPSALGNDRPAVPLIVLLGGIVGGIGGYFMEWYAMAVDYPINVAGRPFNSWPAFVPIMFELTILAASISAVVGMLALNRLPRLHHPVFNVDEFERASTDRFFLCIEAADKKFDPAATRDFLTSLKPILVKEVTK